MLQALGETFLDSLIDSLKMFPWLFLTYVLIELLERKAAFEKRGGVLRGKAAPLFGAAAGVFPQCGVSVMSAKLYDRGIITVGTLLSVFVATSDEAFSVLIASDKRLSLIPLLLIKFVLAVVIGFAVNAFAKKTATRAVKSNGDDLEHEDICAHCHDHVEADENGKKSKRVLFERYALVPLLHALQTFLFVFAVTFIFGVFFGEEGVFELTLNGNGWYVPFLSAAVGLIPNCASSVVVTTAYVEGVISFGAMLAGLISNAGVGLAVLFRNTKKTKRNVALLLSLYAIGAICGLIVQTITPLLFN